MKRIIPAVLAVLTFVTFIPAGTAAFAAPQAPEAAASPAPGGETRTVVAGARYKKGGLYRFLFGSNYRDLWLTPFKADVLNLQTYAGGLKPTRIVGHGQSRGLAFKGGDGRLYTFRPILKDPSGLLPVELRETFARKFVTDQMASGHPAGHTMVAPLLKAVDVVHNDPHLVIVPDDEALGEYQKEFAGQLGDIEEFGGSKGIVAAEENIDGEELWQRLRESPAVRVDSRAYLRARLVDMMIGDWDRHRNQWRWAKIAGNDRFIPIPEDRDQAYVKFDGFVIGIFRQGLPLLVNFSDDFSSMDGLTFDGWDVDRRLLADLEREAFVEEAAKVKASITDAVIEEAARRMPPEYFVKNGAFTIKGLRQRRDEVDHQAMKFYKFLSQKVDIYATDAAEVANVERAPSGDVTVTLGAEGQDPYFKRTFHKNETDEIRLLLFGGNDKVVTKGDTGGILVRAVGGDGADVVDDTGGGRTKAYASGSEDRVLTGKGTKWDQSDYVPPPANKSGAWIPARDWGRRTIKQLRLTGGTDYGAILTASLTSTSYAFRKDPFSARHHFSLSFSSTVKAFRGVYDFDKRLENSNVRLGLTALGSGYDILRFYGFGNETPKIEPDKNSKIENDQFLVAPRVVFPIGKLELSLEPVFKWTNTEPKDNPVFDPAFSNPGTNGFIPPALTVDSVAQIGAGFEARIDTTDKPAWPSRGIKFWAGGHAYPEALDIEDSFGELHGELAAYLSPSVPGKVILMLRGGGKKVFGDFPYFESAFLGGRSVSSIGGLGDDPGVIRGLRPQRYAGDGVVYGNAELRVALGNAFIFVPGEIGILGLYDVGRVYLKGEDSNKWHNGVGGGLWFASPNRRNSVTLSVAKSEGRIGFYIKTGVAF